MYQYYALDNATSCEATRSGVAIFTRIQHHIINQAMKLDIALHLCVDYWRLNAMSRADAYLMPRIEELIDQLGKAKYLTTLGDTARFQIPVG